MTPDKLEPDRRQFLAVGSGLLPTVCSGLPWPGPTTRRDPSKLVRLAVAGGGFGASHHWHEHPHCRVTAVTDLVPERQQALQRNYRCDQVYPSLEDMLERAAGDFDAVAIFTDAPSHARHAQMCLERGKHVVSACPVGLTLEELQGLVELKQKTGLLYMLHESSYYRQPCIAAREAFERGEFGRLCFTELEYYHPGIGTRHNSLSRWQGLNSWRFGFPPLLYPTHSLAFLTGVSRERIVKVSGLGQRVGPDFPEAGENAYNNPFDNEIALGLTSNGNVCRFAVCWQIAAEGERGQWLGEKLSLWMDSSAGQLLSKRTPDRGWQRWEVPNYWESDRLPEPLRHDSGHGGSSAFLSSEFVSAILDEREPAIDIYEAVAMNAPGIVAHQSALQGGVQLDVPQFDPRP